MELLVKTDNNMKKKNKTLQKNKLCLSRPSELQDSISDNKIQWANCERRWLLLRLKFSGLGIRGEELAQNTTQKYKEMESIRKTVRDLGTNGGFIQRTECPKHKKKWMEESPQLSKSRDFSPWEGSRAAEPLLVLRGQGVYLRDLTFRDCGSQWRTIYHTVASVSGFGAQRGQRGEGRKLSVRLETVKTKWNLYKLKPLSVPPQCPSSVAQVSCRISQCPEHGAVHAWPRTRLGSLPTPTPRSSRRTAVRASGSGAWPETSLLGVITLLPHFCLPDLANFSWANEPMTIQGRKIWASIAMLIQRKAPTLDMALWLSSGWCERREVKCTNSDMYPSIVRTCLFSSPRCHTKYRCYRWCLRSDPEDYTQYMAGWKAGSSLGQQSPHSSPQLPTCTLSCPSCSNYYYSGFLLHTSESII